MQLIGEFRASCLFSKVWGLREAAIAKVQLMLNDDELLRSPGFVAALPGLLAIIRVGIDDKFQQVVFQSLGLLDLVIHQATR